MMDNVYLCKGFCTSEKAPKRNSETVSRGCVGRGGEVGTHHNPFCVDLHMKCTWSYKKKESTTCSISLFSFLLHSEKQDSLHS